jgi:hypothetical protein
MSKEHRDAINPPRPIHATPPACAEARAIAARCGAEAKARYMLKDLNAIIEENTPTWRKVLQNLFKGK